MVTGMIGPFEVDNDGEGDGTGIIDDDDVEAAILLMVLLLPSVGVGGIPPDVLLLLPTAEPTERLLLNAGVVDEFV